MSVLSYGIPRSSAWDAVFVLVAALHAAALLAFPSIPLIAIGLWWTANTTAHNFIHRPFFTTAAANTAFSFLLTAIMGIPQIAWRKRHLAHHAGRARSLRMTPQLAAEVCLLVVMWGTLATVDPAFFVGVYAPGWLGGLGLCAVQGHYEHAGGVTSHYGRVYNALCFNDGYHAEHHASPGVHWIQLPDRAAATARSSRWPPLLRWLDAIGLDGLERVALQSPTLQRFVVSRHRRAFERLLPSLPPVQRVAIVGGGLFPRTALVLRNLLPMARITIIDADRDNLETAAALLPFDVGFEHRRFPAPGELGDASFPYDLVVIPLAFKGDREAIYGMRGSAAMVVHDWIWRPRGTSCVVSFALLKRLNLVLRLVPRPDSGSDLADVGSDPGDAADWGRTPEQVDSGLVGRPT